MLGTGCPTAKHPTMTNLNPASLDKPRPAWTLAALPSLAIALPAILGVAAGVSWLGPRGWDWANWGTSRAEALSADAGRFIASICIAQPESEAMRLWIAQHPKSKRGRLDHQRSNAVAAE